MSKLGSKGMLKYSPILWEQIKGHSLHIHGQDPQSGTAEAWPGFWNAVAECLALLFQAIKTTISLAAAACHSLRYEKWNKGTWLCVALVRCLPLPTNSRLMQGKHSMPPAHTRFLNARLLMDNKKKGIHYQVKKRELKCRYLKKKVIVSRKKSVLKILP